MKIVSKQEYKITVNDIENNFEMELYFPFMIFVPYECKQEKNGI